MTYLALVAASDGQGGLRNCSGVALGLAVIGLLATVVRVVDGLVTPPALATGRPRYLAFIITALLPQLPRGQC